MHINYFYCHLAEGPDQPFTSFHTSEFSNFVIPTARYFDGSVCKVSIISESFNQCCMGDIRQRDDWVAYMHGSRRYFPRPRMRTGRSLWLEHTVNLADTADSRKDDCNCRYWSLRSIHQSYQSVDHWCAAVSCQHTFMQTNSKKLLRFPQATLRDTTVKIYNGND